MNQKLMEQLRRITEEEQRILSGETQIDRNLYTGTKDFTIDSKKMLRDGKLIDFRPHTRFIRFPEHRHNYIEIILMCEGSLTHIIDGSHKVILQPGDLLFLNQFAVHEILPAGRNDIAVNFMVLPEFFDTAQKMLDKGNVIYQFLMSALRRDAGEGQYLHFHAAGLLPVLNLAENMIWSLLNNQPDQLHLNQITMGLLFLELVGHTETLSDSGAAQSRSRLTMDALSYIESHYCNGSLTELAAHLNQPIYSLSRLIKSETGSTFKELLQQKRMHQAGWLIRETTLPIGDIITAVGYDNTSFFYRVFREEYGVTPKEYRLRQNAAGKENIF